MRTTGFIGQLDEVSYAWMKRIMSRSYAIKNIPEYYSQNYFINSLIYSKTSNPERSYNLAEKAINKGELYRTRGIFNVVLYPDKDSVLRTPLPPEEIFLWYPAKGCKPFTDEELDREDFPFDEYLNTQTHVSELDYMAEILFSPKCRTVEDFAAESSVIVLHSVPEPDSPAEWSAGTVAKKAAVLSGIAALHDWTAYMRKRVKAAYENNKSYTRLSWYYGKLLREVSEILRVGYASEYSNLLVKTKRSPKSLEISLGKHKAEFNSLMQCSQEIRTAAADILYSAFIRMEGGAFSKGASGKIYMGGCAKSVSCITGGTSESTEYLSWVVRTAALYPDAVFYALALEKWNSLQLKALAKAIKDTASSNLLIWTSADIVPVPPVLTRGDYITSDDIDPETGIIMYSVPRKLTEKEGQEAYGILEGELMIGNIDEKTASILEKKKSDPMYNTPADYGNKIPAVNTPYELLPEDRIEEAREMIYFMTGLTASKINKQGNCSDMRRPPIDVR